MQLVSGLADMISEKLFNKIDMKATYENIITSSYLERGKIPMKFPALNDCPFHCNEYKKLE